MPLTVDVVIGANYGDEGKGLITDYLVNRAQKQGKRVAVVRFNGGAQAGHTVETPKGIRHVFSHIGSGTLLGASTILSDFFVLNPIVFCNEIKELKSKISYEEFQSVRIIKSPHCMLTTPYDVMLNRAAERVRGNSKHGSVGIGFNETIERNIQFSNTFNRNIKFTIEEKLKFISDNWLKLRTSKLGIDGFTDEELDIVSYNNIQKYLDCYDVSSSFLATPFINDIWFTHSIKGYDHLVFEGAQGLLLDQDFGEFPYVTRSNTGLKNVLQLINTIPCKNIEKVNTYYVSRTYLTRHGAGPLPNEEPDFEIQDLTNQPNPWQGKIRCAPLEFTSFFDRTQFDFKTNIIENNKLHYVFTWANENNVEILREITDASLIATGKTRNDVIDFNS